MHSTDKTKPTHTDYLQLKKTTQLNLRGLGIEWAVLDLTLKYATEMEEQTRPKDYNPDDPPIKPRTGTRPILVADESKNTRFDKCKPYKNPTTKMNPARA